MKIQKLSKFQHNYACKELTIHICSLNGKIVYLTLLPDVNIINELIPDYYGILSLHKINHVWHDKEQWLNSNKTQANVGITHGLNDWKILTIKQSLFDYWLDRPK